MAAAAMAFRIGADGIDPEPEQTGKQGGGRRCSDTDPGEQRPAINDIG